MYRSDDFRIDGLGENAPAGCDVVDQLRERGPLHFLPLEVRHRIEKVKAETALAQLPDEQLLLLPRRNICNNNTKKNDERRIPPRVPKGVSTGCIRLPLARWRTTWQPAAAVTKNKTGPSKRVHTHKKKAEGSPGAPPFYPSDCKIPVEIKRLKGSSGCHFLIVLLWGGARNHGIGNFGSSLRPRCFCILNRHAKPPQKREAPQVKPRDV